ncbi:hypothetical protein FRC01_006735 [Tulasnella sp. 417]|nr:hypothetical protein FRC01_006735 [Tulasnella sp. 417]
MLPIAAVFTPVSLGVKAIASAEAGPCVIAAGNMKNTSYGGVPIFSQAHSAPLRFDLHSSPPDNAAPDHTSHKLPEKEEDDRRAERFENLQTLPLERRARRVVYQ